MPAMNRSAVLTAHRLRSSAIVGQARRQQWYVKNLSRRSFPWPRKNASIGTGLVAPCHSDSVTASPSGGMLTRVGRMDAVKQLPAVCVFVYEYFTALGIGRDAASPDH